MRVVHVVTRSHHRGAEVVALELARALDELGHQNDVYAIALASDGGSVADLPALVHTSRLGPSTYLRCWWQLHRILSVRRADVVLAHGGSAAILVALPAATRGATRVWQRILGLPVARWGAVRRGVWAIISRRFDGIVALSRDLESEVRDLAYRGPVWVIPNARDPERFVGADRDAASAALRKQIGISADVPLLAFVGHLVDQKQPELAIEVLARVRQSGHRAHLVVAGEGARRRLVEQRIADLDMSEAVTLLGHRDDPETVFAACDLALITSKAEGVPGVAIEAQMTGCPVVSFEVGAIQDVVEDGVTGALIASADAALMAERVSALLSDNARLRSMGEAAAARAAAFTMSASASLYAQMFAEVGRASHAMSSTDEKADNE